MDGTAVLTLEHAIVYVYGESKLARSENEYEDFSISIKVLALLRDGWSAGPGLFDLACGYAIGLPHSKVFYKRTKRAEYQHKQFMRLIPDYDYSNETPPEDDPTDGRRRFYGNRFTGRLCDMGTAPGSPHDATTTRETDANYAAAGGRMGDWPEAHDCQSVPSSECAADRPGVLDAYRGIAPNRSSSPEQIRAFARFKRRETRAGVMAYFGA
jgi:hypothetical protein